MIAEIKFKAILQCETRQNQNRDALMFHVAKNTVWIIKKNCVKEIYAKSGTFVKLELCRRSD